MSAASSPLVSVVICTRNNATLLRHAILSTLDQDFPGESFEVVVVDNGSSDATRETVFEFTSCRPVRYVLEPSLGLCHARNAGWRCARGRYVAYLDDDALACPGWLAAIPRAFEATTPSPGVVGGRVEPLWEAERPSWLSDHLARGLTIVDWSDRPHLITDLRQEWLAGTNMAAPAAVLAEVGGFHPWLDRAGANMLSSGDVFLEKEIVRRGYPCFYDPAMSVQHRVPASRLSKGWFRRRYYWQGVSDAVMQLLEERPSPARRASDALARTVDLLTCPRDLRALASISDDPDHFERKCFALIAVGHITGLLGAGGH